MPNCKSGSSQSQNKNNYVSYKVRYLYRHTSRARATGHQAMRCKKKLQVQKLDSKIPSFPLPPGSSIFTNLTSSSHPGFMFPPLRPTCTCTLYVVCLNPGCYVPTLHPCMICPDGPAKRASSRVFMAGAIDVIHVLSDDGQCHEHEWVSYMAGCRKKVLWVADSSS
jgi:hypothetical protein